MQNSAKRGWLAKNDRSKALSFEKSGGLGNTPCVNAKISTRMPTDESKIASTARPAPTAG